MLLQLSSTTTKSVLRPIKVFISYSHKDESFKTKLDEHLSVLRRQGFIKSWSDREIAPGKDWKGVIDANLEKSEIVLLLISSSFIASDYCFDVEMKRAIERHRSNESVVIPIIVRPVFWNILPLADLQALPANAKPIALWNNQDEAFTEIVEKLRIVIGNLNDLLLSDQNDVQYKWILQFAEVDHRLGDIGKAILPILRELTRDSKIKISATIEEKRIIILEGSEEAFRVIKKLFNANCLQKKLGYPIHSLYMAYGASIKSSSELDSENVGLSDSSLSCASLVYKSKKHVPILLKSLFVSRRNILDMEFTIDSGHDSPSPEYLEEESNKLIGYFEACLAVKQDDFWVNLSEYESNRMISEALSGTELGRELLAQDCALKKLTASLMHPDTETGKKYWQSVYHKANKLFGTSNVPITSYYKVLMLPGSAEVYQTSLPADLENNPNDVLKSVANMDGHFAYITKAKLSVKCEEDYYAIKANLKSGELGPGGEIPKDKAMLYGFATPIFKEIILPEIEDEINNGINFRSIQQIYHSLILAKWFKQEFSGRKSYDLLVNTNHPGRTQMTLKEIQPISYKKNSNERDSSHRRKENRSVTSFAIPENREFHSIYTKLFREGLFRFARREVDEVSGNIVNRTYFSGGIVLTISCLNQCIESTEVRGVGKMYNKTLGRW